MERREKIKRFILRLLIFCMGLVFLSLGIDLNTKTQLDISPINSVPFNVHQPVSYTHLDVYKRQISARLGE